MTLICKYVYACSHSTASGDDYEGHIVALMDREIHMQFDEKQSVIGPSDSLVGTC